MSEENQAETGRDRTGDPLQFKLYKGVKGKFGALRMNLQKPYSGRKDQGCIFLEMCPAVGPNQYDWENQKVIIALAINDISQILDYLSSFSKYPENTLSLYHDKGAGTPNAGKDTVSLRINKPADRDNFFWTLTKNAGETPKTSTVPVSPAETRAIVELLRSAIPTILAWK